MSDESENRIIVLQNVTLETNPVKNILMEKTTCNRNSPTSHNEEERNSNMQDYIKRRRTASSYIFDEEPIFSDSEEEKEYCKNVLARQKCLDVINESPKRLDVEVQCNLSSDNLKIVDVIQKCARINDDDINEDFKRLVDMCKELQFKYNVTQAASENRSFGNVIPNNKTAEQTMFNSQNLRNVHELTPMSTSEDRFSQEKFLPSRKGSSKGDDAFSSHTFSSDSGIANISFISKSVNSNEGKENVRRKSNRMRKPVHLFSPGKFITCKDIKNVLKRNQIRIKTKNIKAKQKKLSKTSSKKNNGANTAMRRKLAKDIDDFNIGINKDINIRQRKTSSDKPMKPKTSAVLNNTYDNFMRIKAVYLPKHEIKLLARNWMKPHKRDEKNYKLPDDGKSVLLQQKPKFRRLYSPNEWLHSQELADLYIK